jgi:hypothetical protein
MGTPTLLDPLERASLNQCPFYLRTETDTGFETLCFFRNVRRWTKSRNISPSPIHLSQNHLELIDSVSKYNTEDGSIMFLRNGITIHNIQHNVHPRNNLKSHVGYESVI